ncbi:aminotransferase class V-fold PLP-dependent enzyme [Streptomyces sp. WMMC1477]|uniref:aminotransferase class V-fold PLP-dependent enzyme n=1 Tax=Streptomyces sp. WMMC1477 TaxID=3015155 RepID=UPI0022B61EDB|nr:aminotransferase class V-fold PLP-dependent enzyme [Streptomyces sp. WMMC1477]MCZ7430587.1 aminotransferase class V-fold PLP-dependent enzyme [Streptomyces sp. WMMC1477]
MSISMGAEFAPQTTYLNTAAHGVFPVRTAAALRSAVEDMAAARLDHHALIERIEEARTSFAAVVGLPVGRVATGSAVSVHVGMIAQSLPEGTEVLVAESDFSSLVNPFHVRPDLALRQAPLEGLAEAVRPGTGLVAVSAVQSADGRVADLVGVSSAARAVGARVLVDTTQSTGWLPMDPALADYTVCGAYKWLLCPRGTSFLTVPEDGGGLRPTHAGWFAGENRWETCYGPIDELAGSARRFDECPPYLPFVGAAASLGLIEEVGPAAIGEHNKKLAARFRAGAVEAGHRPVAGDSAIVAVPGLGDAVPGLAKAGVDVSARAGNLRASFHLFNTTADVDRLLAALAGLR